MYAQKQNRRRLALSILCAMFLHAAFFIMFQYLLPIWTFQIPEYTGPLEVTIERETRPILHESAEKVVEQKVEAEETPPVTEILVPQEKKPQVQPAEQQVTRVHEPARRVKESTLPVRGGESSAVSSSRGIPQPEIIEEEIPAPVEEESVMPPIKGRAFQEEKTPDVPFTPESEVESESLAFDIEHLDKALGKGEERPVQAGPGTGKTERTQPATSRTPSSRAPMIEWDNVASARTLTYAGPSPAIPSWVKKEGLDLKLSVSFAVTPEGHTTSVRIRTSSGYTDVDTAVLDTVRKMKFNPDPRSGPVTGTITYIISPK
jgi:TonB family protein